jgi:hypothetical protein
MIVRFAQFIEKAGNITDLPIAEVMTPRTYIKTQAEPKDRPKMYQALNDLHLKGKLPDTYEFTGKPGEKQPLSGPAMKPTNAVSLRALVNPTTSTKLVEGSIAKAITSYLKAHPRYHRHFIHALNAEQLQAFLETEIRKVNDPVMGEWDHKNNDAHQHAAINEVYDCNIFSKLAARIMPRLGFSNSICKRVLKRWSNTNRRMRMVIKKGRKRMCIVRATIKGTTISGEPMTMNKNTVHTLEYIKFVLDLARIPDIPSNIAYFASGDDALIAISRPLVAQFEEAYWKVYNCEANESPHGLGQWAKNYHIGGPVTFLSKHIGIGNHCVDVFRPLNRFVITGVTSVKIVDPSLHASYHANITAQIAKWGGIGLPMHLANARSYLETGATTKGKVIVSELYQKELKYQMSPGKQHKWRASKAYAKLNTMVTGYSLDQFFSLLVAETGATYTD